MYLLLTSGSQCTVFTLFPESFPTLPAVEYGCSAFEYLCQHRAPDEQTKVRRFTFDLNKRLPQGAKNFAQRVQTRFNFMTAYRLFQSLGGIQ